MNKHITPESTTAMRQIQTISSLSTNKASFIIVQKQPLMTGQYPADTSLRAQFEFQSVEPGEISITQGDLVVLLEDDQADQRPGWIKVVNRSLGPNNGESGYVPFDYVVPEDLYQPDIVVVKDDLVETDHSLDTPAVDQEAPSLRQSHQQQDSVAADQDPAPSNEQRPATPSLSSTNEIQPGTQVVMRFPYEAQKADELELKVGDIVHVLISPEGGWWKGMCGLGKQSKVGWFPANMCEVLLAKESPKQEPPSSSDTSKPGKRTSWFKKVVGGKSQEDSGNASRQNKNRSRASTIETSVPSFSASPTLPAMKETSPTNSRPMSIIGSVAGSPVTGVRDAAARRKPSDLVRDLSSAMSLDQGSAIQPPQLSPSSSQSNSKSWKDDLDSDSLAQLTTSDRKRQEVIWELLTTERDYLRDLKIVLEVRLSRAFFLLELSLKIVDLYAACSRKEGLLSEAFHAGLC